MTNIIEFPDKNAPASDCVYKDHNGDTWYKYSVSYDDGREYTFQLWAKSIEDAERRLKLPMKVKCQIIKEV